MEPRHPRGRSDAARQTVQPALPLAKGIPFQLNANKIYTQVSVNNTGPYWFILDSGSIFNVLDLERAKALRIALHGNSTVRGMGAESVVSTSVSNVSLRLGGLELKSQDLTVIPVDSLLAHSEGRQIDGLLGYEFIRHYCIEIDYQSRMLNILPSACDYPAGGQIVPMQIENDALYVTGFIHTGDLTIQGKFLIDTAVRSALVLNTPFVESNDLLSHAGQTVPAWGTGIGGQTSARIGRVAALRLGDLEIKEPIVDFSEMKKGVLASSNFSGIIGGEILRRFKLILDCPRSRLILEPALDSQKPFEYDMSGLALNAEGQFLNVFRVVQVTSHSPAEEAGMRPGDVIAKIDGQPALSLEQISQTFKQGAGNLHEIIFKRGMQEIKCTIKLRRLI
ncbi:MAG TPA: aspartyl protease family protein [Candidatus Angelobacter sp.]|nr:aspartyl protease family protein [Candidatus Angelobacter sp.]